MVAVKTLEDVELVVDTSTVDKLEDLHKDKNVEDERSYFSLVVAKDRIATEPKDEAHNKLVNRLTDDHLPHGDGDKRGGARLGLTVEKTSGGRIRSESKSGESIHDEVNPEKLNSVENRLLLVI
jgi:hypothetical protein